MAAADIPFNGALLTTKLKLANGANFISLESPSLGGNFAYTLPSAFPGVTGYVLSCDTSGVMSWVAQSGGSGEANTASNVGSGAGVWKDKSGVDLRFKSLTIGTDTRKGADWTTNTNDLALNVPGLVPVGGIVAWHKALVSSVTLPANWVECSGQTISDADSPLNGAVIPNLNGVTGGGAAAGAKVFLRGDTNSGGSTVPTGGADRHDHSIIGTSVCSGSSSSPGASKLSYFVTVDASNIPSYFAVVWIMRIK